MDSLIDKEISMMSLRVCLIARLKFMRMNGSGLAQLKM